MRFLASPNGATSSSQISEPGFDSVPWGLVDDDIFDLGSCQELEAALFKRDVVELWLGRCALFNVHYAAAFFVTVLGHVFAKEGIGYRFFVGGCAQAFLASVPTAHPGCVGSPEGLALFRFLVGDVGQKGPEHLLPDSF